MDDFQPSIPSERSSEAEQKHHREVLLQITLPLIIFVLIILALAVFAATGAPGNVSRWASVSLIWLLVPMILLAFIFLIILGGLAFGVTRLIGILPEYAHKVQDIFDRIGDLVKQGSDAAVEPFLRVQSFLASVQAVKRNLKRE
jgi:Na+/H+ antiporter NhaC